MTDMTMVSLFDGVGGFPEACRRAGIRTVATVEIDGPAAGVTAEHFPDAKHFSDVTEVTADDLRAAGFDPARGVLTGGWPCQDLSLAGRRLGLDGSRSGLFFEIVRLAADLRPRWLILENVPGLLSAVCSCPGLGVCGDGCIDPHPVSGGSCGIRGRGKRRRGRCMEIHGGAMGAVLGSLAELGYGFAYRVLDAQHFGVPQRRRRVVIVGCLGDWAAPTQVLLEPEGGGGDPAASRAPAARVAGRTARRADRTRREVVTAIGLSGIGGNGGPDDNAAQGGHLIAAMTDAAPSVIAHHGRNNPGQDGLIAFDHKASSTSRGPNASEVPSALKAGRQDEVGTAAAVRRLTPVECERLQGYPDGWTAVSNGRPQADSARYRQLGNSIAGPVFEWVARRIAAYENSPDGTLDTYPKLDRVGA